MFVFRVISCVRCDCINQYRELTPSMCYDLCQLLLGVVSYMCCASHQHRIVASCAYCGLFLSPFEIMSCSCCVCISALLSHYLRAAIIVEE